MALEVTVLNGGGTASGTADISTRVRADLGVSIVNRAYDGQGGQGFVWFDDDDGEYGDAADLPGGLTMLSVAAHNVVTVTEDTTGTVLLRGRVGEKAIGRGEIHQSRSRQVKVTLLDGNADLDGITLTADEVRGSESDVTRMTWVLTDYLSGNERLTTDFPGLLIINADTVTMPGKTYEAGTEILDIIRDCVTASGKACFVYNDGTGVLDLYYASNDDTTLQAGLRISDDPDLITVGESSEGASSVRLYPSDIDSGSDSSLPEVDTAPALTDGSIDAAWTVTSGDAGNYRYMFDDPQSSSSTVNRQWDGVNISARDVAVAGFVHVLDGDLLSIIQNGGVVRGQHRSRARSGIGISEASQMQFATFAVRIYRNGVGFVETLVEVGDSVGTVRFPPQSTPVNRSFGPFTFPASAEAVEGDYVVVDVGNRHTAPTSGGTGAGSYWADHNTSDLPIDDSTTENLNSWWQFGPPEDAVPTYPPIWVDNKAQIENGQDLLSGGVLRYSGGVVFDNDQNLVDQYDHYVKPINDVQAVDATDAANRLAAVLATRNEEDRTTTVAVQLHVTEMGLLHAGDLIDINAKAIPDADDQFDTRRIVSLEWQWIGPEHYYAVMELNRPLVGVGNPGSSLASKSEVDAVQKADAAVTAHEGSADPHSGYVRESEFTAKGDLLIGTGSGTLDNLTAGTNGHVLTLDSAETTGVKWAASGGGGGGGNPVVYDIEIYTGGDISVTSSSAGAALSGPGTVTVAAASGDLVMLGVNAIDTTSSSNSLRMDVGTIVSAAVVNYLSSLSGTPATLGVSGWFSHASEEYQHTGEVPYIVQAGDISGGNVEFSLRAWISGATARSIGAAAGNPLVFWVRNLGQ